MFGQYESKLSRLDELTRTIEERKARRKLMDSFIARLDNIDGMLTVFDDDLWCGMLDYMTVNTKDDVVFTFIGGIEFKL